MSTGPSYSYVGVPIHAVFSQREVYDTYPSCQRDYVWTKGMQQKLVDSILRGLPIPPITVLPTNDTSLMGVMYQIVDGQQRLKTILKFKDGEFKTAQSFTLEPGIKPVEPGKFFHELSPAAKHDFDFYSLQFCFIKDVDVRETGLIYRRLNYQVKLKFSEVLYSYQSKAKDLADSLYEHTFWNTIHDGKKDRKQVFMMGVHIIFMELMDVFANMTSPRLAEIVYGRKDDELTSPELRKRILKILTGLENVFKGATIKSSVEIIPIYQAGLLLQEDGYDLCKSKEGCLANWYMTTKRDAMESRRQGLSDPISILTNVNRQRSFWEQHLVNLYKAEGLFKKDSKRLFSELDKIKAWDRQNGKCLLCGKPVRISDEGHHAIEYSRGGKTTSENCVLVHKECHLNYHNNPSQLSLL
jgi:hypothetical protein